MCREYLAGLGWNGEQRWEIWGVETSGGDGSETGSVLGEKQIRPVSMPASPWTSGTKRSESNSINANNIVHRP